MKVCQCSFLTWILLVSVPVYPGYDYEDIVQEYCNAKKDWGAIPGPPPEAEHLLQVQVFTRHGARTQRLSKPPWLGEKEIEKGEFKCELSYVDSSVGVSKGRPCRLGLLFRIVSDNAPGSCVPGQLTEDGFDMHLQNGRRLREAYVDRTDLLPTSIDVADLDMMERTFMLRSTDVPRTRQSAMAIFSGLYGGKESGTSLPYVNLRTTTREEENLAPNINLCAALREAQDAYWEQLAGTHAGNTLITLCKDLAPQQRASWQSLRCRFGEGPLASCAWFLEHIMDSIMSRACPTVPFFPKNATLPDAFLEDDAALLRRVWRVFDQTWFDFFKATAKLGAGAMIAEVLNATDAAVLLGRGAHKFRLYSGHDVGPIAPLWQAFGLRPDPPYWPPFASMTILELWKTADGHGVRWIVNGKVAGGGLQPYADFHAYASKLVPRKEDCSRPPLLHEAGICEWWSWTSASAGAAFLFSVEVILLSASYCFCKKRRLAHLSQTSAEDGTSLHTEMAGYWGVIRAKSEPSLLRTSARDDPAKVMDVSMLRW